MKKKILGAFALITAAAMLSGCATSETSSVASSSGAADGGSSSIGDSSSDSGFSSDVFDRSATRISLSNGNMEISRRTRENTQSMGDGNWTIFVYLCGSDLESEGGCATEDIMEILAGTYSDKVTFVFETGGANAWNSGISSSKLQRYINVQNNLSLVDEQPAANMGDQATLESFLSWGVENYAAENMGVIFWNHGGGSIAGVCFDETNNHDSLSLNEIDGAMNSVYDKMTDKFEFVGFDACLMSTLETANRLVPYANYMIASAEVEPGTGWNYTDITNYLAQNPTADGAQLGKVIADSFYQTNEQMGDNLISTLCITDLSKVDALITSFNTTAQQIHDSGNLNAFARAVQSCENYGGNNRTEGYTNMVDLGAIISAMGENAGNASDTLAKLEDAVSYKINGPQHAQSSGLSIYYPLSVQGSEELSIFASICPSTYYLAIVDALAYGTTGQNISDYDNSSLLEDTDNFWDLDYDYGDYSTNGDSYGDFADTTIPVESVYFNEDGYYTMLISDGSNFSYAACSIFMVDYSDNSVIYLGSDDDVVYGEDGYTIIDNFNGEWLSLDDGTILPIDIVTQTNELSIYTCPIYLNGKYTNLRIEYNWNSGAYSVIGTWEGINSETGMSARDTVKLKDGDVITPCYTYYLDDGSEDYFIGEDYIVNGEVGIMYGYLPSGDYYYNITLYDIFGNRFFGPTVTFTVEEDGSISFIEDELDEYNNDYGYDDYGYDDYGYDDDDYYFEW